jgi:ectoine hydroxylase-related dioxygenase (phytanoyl-CoA dioxygenase family)
MSIPLKDYKALDYPPLTEDLEEAKSHLDKYGMALIKDALSKDEVHEMGERLIEQFQGEEKFKVGSKLRGDEGLGVKSSDEEKVSRLVWNLINKGDCFLKLIDHPKVLPLIQHMIGERVCLCSMGAHMNGSGNERMALHQDQWPLVPHAMDFPFMANVMYLISDNSPENGGTRLIPGSHKWPLLDYKSANAEEIQSMAVSLTAPKGTAIVWEGRLWHGNGLNRSGSIRSNISTAFLQPWVKPQEYHQYSIRDEVLEEISEKQKHILGFSSYGTLGGHDGSSVSPADFDPNKDSIGILKP